MIRKAARMVLSIPGGGYVTRPRTDVPHLPIPVDVYYNVRLNIFKIPRRTMHTILVSLSCLGRMYNPLFQPLFQQEKPISRVLGHTKCCLAGVVGLYIMGLNNRVGGREIYRQRYTYHT